MYLVAKTRLHPPKHSCATGMSVSQLEWCKYILTLRFPYVMLADGRASTRKSCDIIESTQAFELGITFAHKCTFYIHDTCKIPIHVFGTDAEGHRWGR